MNLESVADVGQEVEVTVSFSTNGTQFAQATVRRIISAGEKATAYATVATSSAADDGNAVADVPDNYTAAIADVRVIREVEGSWQNPTPTTSVQSSPSGTAVPQAQAPQQGSKSKSKVRLPENSGEAFQYVCFTSPEDLPILRSGSADRYGTAALQYVLQTGPYNVGPVDGLYGPVTQAAVREFQTDFGLIVDGLTGPQTWSTLQDAACGE